MNILVRFSLLFLSFIMWSCIWEELLVPLLYFLSFLIWFFLGFLWIFTMITLACFIENIWHCRWIFKWKSVGHWGGWEERFILRCMLFETTTVIKASVLFQRWWIYRVAKNCDAFFSEIWITRVTFERYLVLVALNSPPWTLPQESACDQINCTHPFPKQFRTPKSREIFTRINIKHLCATMWHVYTWCLIQISSLPNTEATFPVTLPLLMPKSDKFDVPNFASAIEVMLSMIRCMRDSIQN